MRPQFHHRRKSDPELKYPTVPAPHVPPESPPAHLRNALQLVRVSMDFGEFVHGNGGPAVIVGLDVLDGIQRRIEAALSLLELDGPACCTRCRGTILAPTIGGVPRGTCRCPRERTTDWSAKNVQIDHE